MSGADFIPPHDATTRFSGRVEDYVRFRPDYPSEIIEYLSTDFGLTGAHRIADIGSGTGIFSEALLRNGNTVYGVEPNQEMREAAERLLGDFERFVSVAATAEATTLPANDVDWITSAQAFHWFDVERCRREFARILRPGGYVALIWNNRRRNSPFAKEYARLLHEFGTDYDEIRHDKAETDGRVASFFARDEGARGDETHPQVSTAGRQSFAVRSFDNSQRCDGEALRGRTLSASYMPAVGDSRYPAMIEALEGIFRRYAQAGHVVLEYNTYVYVGTLG